MSLVVRAVITCDAGIGVPGMPQCEAMLLAANSEFGVNAARDNNGWVTSRDGRDFCSLHRSEADAA